MPLAGDDVAGGVALVLLIAGLLVWFKLSRKRKATPRGKVIAWPQFSVLR